MRILSNESDIINDIKYYIRNKQNSQVQLNANLLFWGNLCENAYLQGLTDTKDLSCGIAGYPSLQFLLAVKAVHLIEFYLKRGYRKVDVLTGI